MTFGGDIVREARTRAGLSQEDLAGRLATAQPVIARWESGRRSPTMTDVIRAIRVCGVQLNLNLESRDLGHEGLIIQASRRSPEDRLVDLESAQHFTGPLRGVASNIPNPSPKLHILELIRQLYDQRVRYVLIGMAAAKVHCSPYVTDGMDICPSLQGSNLSRLRAFLRQVIADEPTTELASDLGITSFRTNLGEFKVAPRPTGSRGYGQLLRRSQQVMIHGIPVRVAGLEDIIASKQTLNRSTDRVHLLALRMIRQMQETGELAILT